MSFTRLMCFAVLVILASGTVPAFGQSSGAILGTVMDASGALIPGVDVTVTNQGTNQSRQAVTNESGGYRIEPLQSGIYSVSAELVGFRKEIQTDIKIDVDARARVDFRLEVGAVSEVIEVTGAAPIVQTDNSQVGQVIEERKIVELPLNGRVFTSLVYLAPGAFAPRPNSRLADRGGFQVVGGDEETNEILIDGTNANGGVTLEAVITRLNVDAVGEFKVQTQNYSAQYGRFAGGHVDAVIKSGTNEFHGGLFGFTRNSALDARNFFDPGKLPAFRRHQYGGLLGGPIRRDKAFFFVAFQGQRQAQFITTNPTILLPEFWAGDLSRIKDAAGNQKVIRDPATGQPFPNNQIPKERISPTSLAFRPHFDRAKLINNSLARNATALLNSPENYWHPIVKINYNLSPKHQITGSWAFFNGDMSEWNYAGSPELPGGMIAAKMHTQVIALQDIVTISPTMVNEARAGLGRIMRTRLNESDDVYLKPGIDYARTVFGLPQTSASFDERCWRNLPQVMITGYSRVGVGSGNCNPEWTHGNLSFSDTLSIQHGNHALKIGADLFEQQRLKATGADNGSYTFTGSASGDATADFLLGYINVATSNIPLGMITNYLTRWSTNWFIQDDWKVARNLTFNLGVRYELNMPMGEKYGQLSFFDPTLDGGRGGIRILKQAPDHYQPAIDFYKKLYPDLVIATTDQRNVVDKNNVNPRLGFAWSPGGGTNTAIRGGYGIITTVYALTVQNGVPFNLNRRYTRANNPTWANPFPGVGASGTVTTIGWNYNKRDTYVQQWNLGIQRQIPMGVVLDFSYVGKKGTKIEDGNGQMTRDINQPVNGVRPYPLFGPIQSTWGGSTIYHGLQARVERRSTSGATFLVAYAWGQMLGDVTSASGGTGGSANTSANTRDGGNTRAERGPERDDLKHRVSISLVAPLPIGRNRAFLSNLGGLPNALFGGWNLSAIIRANSGSPIAPTVTTDFSGSGNFTDRPDIIGNPKLGDKASPAAWWDITAFANPARGTFGTAGKGSLLGPGYFGTDLSILKNFSISESQTMQFRWEMFNVFNQTNFLAPNSIYGSPAFGTIGSAYPGRQMQAGLKYNF